MIKSVWIIASTIALANVLALAGFGAWLGATQRIDLARLERIRAMISEPIPAERARVDAEAEAEALAAAEAAEAARANLPSLTAGEALTVTRELEERHRQIVDRLRREVADLQRALVLEREALDKEWTALRAERTAFEEMRAEIAQLEGAEQFERTVRLYESLRAAQARQMMQELIDTGEIEQVVAYLNAMQVRSASKILTEFGNDPPLAADLLERLRTRGFQARAP